MYQSFSKRLIDIILSAIALFVLSPVILILAFLVRLKHGSPILFRQQRPGLHGRSFTLLKFRSMTNEHDGEGNLLPDADRLTTFGRFLRRTSLDELPELVNVLNGNMSLVGPRPLLMQYLCRYTPEQARRHTVRPGITGWAQVNGRQEMLFSQRIKYDLWYIDHLSLWLDFKILLLTVIRVFTRRGVIPGQDVAEVDDLGLYLSDTIDLKD